MLEIKQAIEIKLNSILPVIQTSYENSPFTPTTGTPYQEVTFLLAYNDNAFIDNSGYLSYGLVQILLKYPTGSGSNAILSRVKLYLDNFKSGTILTKDGIETNIQGTPTVKNLGVVGDRICYAISINYMAHIEN